MTTERKEPDVLVANTGWGGTPVVGDIQADPDSKSWTAADPLRATDNNTSTDIHCSFPTPTDTLTSGADLQEFRVQCREFDSAQTGTATIRVELWEFEGASWGLVRASGETNITGDSSSTTAQVVAFTWNATEITTNSGANVGIKVFCTRSMGSPTVRQTGDIGAVEWNVDYTVAASTKKLTTLQNLDRGVGQLSASRLGGKLQ